MQIIFNGKTYNSVDEMPASERQAYEQMFQIFTDKNGNGIPDFLEGDIAKNVMTAFTNIVHYDGKMYNSMDELPPEARQKLQDAFAKLNQLGIVTNMPAAQAKQAFEPAFQPSKPLIAQEPTIQKSGGRNWMIIVGFLAAMLVCAVAIAVFAFLR
ncbi:MAG: hypothetical protein C4583_16765 [Anaerolineaceae bacterium]|nr:MAG: hypothetical protein C4583_16765 [Anaerolineaceae bacterium]